MKTELVALDPTLKKNSSLDRFLEILRLFKSRGIFSIRSVASVVNPSLYALPFSVYREAKERLIKEAKHNIEAALQGKMDFLPIHVLTSDSQATEPHVNQLARYANRLSADALILASNDRSGLPYWFLGSFSETAALMSKVPVFIIKASLDKSDFPNEVRFVFAVDVAAPPSANAVRWISDLAKPSGARIELLCVKPKKRVLIDSLQQRKSGEEAGRVLKTLEASFKSNGVQTRSRVLDESKSVAHTVADFADEIRASLTIVTGVERTSARKLLLGSTARKILTLTRRPFLSLRLH